MKQNKSFDLIKISTTKEGLLTFDISDNFVRTLKHTKDLEQLKITLIEFFSDSIVSIIKDHVDESARKD